MPALGRSSGPVYLAIAEAIAGDIAAGRLQPGTRLPPQRTLAEALGIDFTTVTRAYAEAGKRGLVEGRVGHGTYVRLRQKQAAPGPGRAVDISMNLPPRFEDAALNSRMQAGIAEVSREGLDLFLAYQDPGGADWDCAAGAQWLAPRLPGVAADRRKRRKLSFMIRNCGSVVMSPRRTSCRMALPFEGFSRPSSAS